MRLLACLIIVSFLYSAPTYADLHWTRVAKPDDVQIEVKSLVPSELRKVHEKYGREGAHVGLAVLMRMSDGTYRCEIYLKQGAFKGALDHEKKHCRGWVH